MHLRAVGGGQMRLLGVKAMWDMGLRHQGIPAGARGLWAKWLLNTNHVIFLLLLLWSKRTPKNLTSQAEFPKTKIITFEYFPLAPLGFCSVIYYLLTKECS